MCQWYSINLRQLQGFQWHVESYQILLKPIVRGSSNCLVFTYQILLTGLGWWRPLKTWSCKLQHMFCKVWWGGHTVQCRSLCCGKMSITLLQTSGSGGTLPDLISPHNDKYWQPWEFSLHSTELSSLQYSFGHNGSLQLQICNLRWQQKTLEC